MMKKIACLLAALLLLVSSAVAETLTIDLATATEEEVSAALDKLQAAKIELIKARLANEVIEPATDGIIFRSIPWYSSLEQAEKMLGLECSYKRPGNIYRLNYIDSKGFITGDSYVEGELGVRTWYNVSVAGYTPSSTYLNFIFPISNGEIIRDTNLAQLYMAYYEFEKADFGDMDSVYTDLESKLNKLYGTGNHVDGKYDTVTTWKDEAGATVRLMVNSSKSYMTLAYVAPGADAHIDEMAQAYLDEKTRAEEMLRLENSNNTDGL